MKYKKQIIIPVVAVSSLAAAAVPVAMATTANKQETPRFDASSSLFNIENGVLKGFKPGVTQEQIDEYTKDGVLRLPACKTIGANAFRNLNAPFAETIVIDSEIENIEAYSFYGSTASEVTFSEEGKSSLASIGDHAFAQCENLTAFPFPKTFNSIGDYAFMGCKSLRELDFSSFVDDTSGLFDATNKIAINNIGLGKACFAGVLPFGTATGSLTISVGEFDDNSLGCDESSYGARFVLSQFASSLQLKIDYASSQKEDWIAGQTKNAGGEVINSFDICTIVPTNYFDIDQQGVVNGTTPEGKKALKYIKYSAIQFPSEAKSFGNDFWKDEGIQNLKESITDLDFYESQITEIPDNFLYDETSGEILTNLQNVRLGSTVSSIGRRAFFSNGLSNLSWININSSSLTNIGDDAFSGNQNLISFGDNPLKRGEEESSQEFVIDYSRRSELTIGAYAFFNTGIYNIVFKNVTPDSTPANVTYGQYAFGSLENLISITFDNFAFGATYDSAKKEITIDEDDNASQIIENMYHRGGVPRKLFEGSFFRGSGLGENCFIKIPSWQNTEISGVYSDKDYFYNINPNTPTISNNILGDSLYNFLTNDMTYEEFEVFNDCWEIRGSESEHLVFDDQTEDANIDEVRPTSDYPVEGEDFEINVSFKATGDEMSIDREKTIINIDNQLISNETFNYWILNTSKDGQTATITIPGEYIHGDISVQLVSKARQTTASGNINLNYDEEAFDIPTFTPETINEGEEFTLSLNNKVEGPEIDTDASEIIIDGNEIKYGAEGWTIEKDTSKTIIHILGWANVWTQKVPEISIDIKLPAINYQVDLKDPYEGFQTKPKYPTTITSGENMQPIDLSRSTLVSGFEYVGIFKLQFYDSKSPEFIIDSYDLDYNETDQQLTLKTPVPRRTDCDKAYLYIDLGKPHAVSYEIDPASQAELSLDSAPEKIYERHDFGFNCTASNNRQLDLSQSLVTTTKGAQTLQDLIDSGRITISEKGPDEGHRWYTISFTEQGIADLSISDITISLVLQAE